MEIRSAYFSQKCINSVYNLKEVAITLAISTIAIGILLFISNNFAAGTACVAVGGSMFGLASISFYIFIRNCSAKKNPPLVNTSGFHLAQQSKLKDVRFCIFSLLPSKDLARIGRVCKLWQQESNNNQLWEALYKKEIGDQLESEDGWKDALVKEARFAFLIKMVLPKIKKINLTSDWVTQTGFTFSKEIIFIAEGWGVTVLKRKNLKILGQFLAHESYVGTLECVGDTLITSGKTFRLWDINALNNTSPLFHARPKRINPDPNLGPDYDVCKKQKDKKQFSFENLADHQFGVSLFYGLPAFYCQPERPQRYYRNNIFSIEAQDPKGSWNYDTLLVKKNNQLIYTLKQDSIHSFQMINDKLISIGEADIIIWDLTSGKYSKTFKHTLRVIGVNVDCRFKMMGSILLCWSIRNTVILRFNIETGVQLDSITVPYITHHVDWIHNIIIVYGGIGCLKLYDAKTGVFLKDIPLDLEQHDFSKFLLDRELCRIYLRSGGTFNVLDFSST